MPKNQRLRRPGLSKTRGNSSRFAGTPKSDGGQEAIFSCKLRHIRNARTGRSTLFGRSGTPRALGKLISRQIRNGGAPRKPSFGRSGTQRAFGTLISWQIRNGGALEKPSFGRSGTAGPWGSRLSADRERQDPGEAVFRQIRSALVPVSITLRQIGNKFAADRERRPRQNRNRLTAEWEQAASKISELEWRFLYSDCPNFLTKSLNSLTDHG